RVRLGSAESIFALDLIFAQPADTGKWPPAIRDRHRHDDLIGARSIVYPHLHAVEMTAHEGCVLVSERDIDWHPRTAAFLRGRNERGAFAESLTEWRAKLRMQDSCGMLQLAILADRGGLAIALDPFARNAESRHGALR